MKLIPLLPRNIIQLTTCLFLYCLSSQAWSVLSYCHKRGVFYETVYQDESVPNTLKIAPDTAGSDSSQHKRQANKFTRIRKEAQRNCKLKCEKFSLTDTEIQKKIPSNHSLFIGRIQQGLFAENCYKHKTPSIGKEDKILERLR